ncbi:hypothetical protein [Microcoleus sp. SVA1_A4]|uniref:hypothetical protein n=1 Tax=Microcoleus sp. SVA1_A4 TaxID=2818948 RepID=UPI002FD480DA
MRMHLAAPHRSQCHQNGRKNNLGDRQVRLRISFAIIYINTLIDSICRTTTTTDMLTRSRKPLARSPDRPLPENLAIFKRSHNIEHR